jgi:hypothetical protein
MPYTSAYPKQFIAFMKFLNMETTGDPTAEETALYTWFDDVFTTCYVEAESYCGQPLRTGTVYYQFYASKCQQGLEANHSWKFVPYNANTTLTVLQWRENEFATYANYSATNYNYNQEPYANYIVFRDKSTGQFKATLSTGWTDTNMPYQILQGIAEMAGLIYKQSPNGGNWFGLGSISSGGAGQTVSNSLKEKIDWQKYFAKYVIPTV